MATRKVIPLFVTNLLDSRTVPLYGDGGNVRDWLHVDDHCAGIQQVIDKGPPGEIYNIGGGTELPAGSSPSCFSRPAVATGSASNTSPTGSQVHWPWYAREAFLGLARIRGIECGGSADFMTFSGGRNDTKQSQLAMLWVLDLSDGEHSLVRIAE